MSVNEVKLHKAPFALEVRGTGPISSRTFAIGNEDHTLGNALRHVLIQNDKVEFTGYSVPHPAEPIVQIRVQTKKNSQSSKRRTTNQEEDDDYDENDIIEPEYRATSVLKEACETLYQQCEIVLEKLEEKIPYTKQDKITVDKRLEELVQEEADDDEDGDDDFDHGDDDVDMHEGMETMEE